MLLPNGSFLCSSHRSLPAAAPAIEVRRPEALLERLAHDAAIGVGEGYMAGDWRAADGTDLADAIVPFTQRLATPGSGRRSVMRAVLDRADAATPAATTGRRISVEDQYDLDTDLFASFLDETMTYSGAIFDQARPWAEQATEAAQLRKIRTVLDHGRVTAGSQILEICTGWGALAVEAARRGAHVTTLTLSTDQAAYAQRRVDQADVDDLVDMRPSDYRDVAGTFDAVVSVEMMESVGEASWPAYVGAIDRVLAPGGIAVVQTILVSDVQYLAGRNAAAWSQKHIAPGARIPSLPALQRTCAARTRLNVDSVHRFGPHYTETARRWRTALDARWPAARTRGFPEALRRKWEFYLASRQAGFATGALDVGQVLLQRGPR